MNLGQVIGAAGARGGFGGVSALDLERWRAQAQPRVHVRLSVDASPTVLPGAEAVRVGRRRWREPAVREVLARQALWTVTQLQAALSVNEANAHYWMKKLQRAGAVELSVPNRRGGRRGVPAGAVWKVVG